MTLDLGAGPMEVLSNNPISYGQWQELVIDRRGYYITVIVRSQEGQVSYLAGGSRGFSDSIVDHGSQPNILDVCFYLGLFGFVLSYVSIKSYVSINKMANLILCQVFDVCFRNCMLSTHSSKLNSMLGTFSDMCPERLDCCCRVKSPKTQ